MLIDSTFKICPTAVEGLEDFISKMHDLSETADTNIVLLISASEDELPSSINAVCEKL